MHRLEEFIEGYRLRTLRTRTVIHQNINPCFFTPLKLHHRGETATSVDYLSFLCYPMDCKADPFSAMHREYAELVYTAHLCSDIYVQISDNTQSEK